MARTTFRDLCTTLFPTEFTNPLEYNVATGNWATDWNFAHTGYDSGGASPDPWKWRINFDLPRVPASGNATLTLAWASVNSAAMQIFVNDESTVFRDFYPNAACGGNALIRQGVHAKYGVDYIAIPVSLLRQGNEYDYAGAAPREQHREPRHVRLFEPRIAVAPDVFKKEYSKDKK